jgi:class 3 adenylate cyclase
MREQRKVVTILFCDVVGSTALGESTDPEALRARMRRYFEDLRVILERHGGSVEKFVGDAAMAVFGIPVSHEDDALRAVRAAAEMREAIAKHGLEARIGINTGEVVVGGEGETLVTGDAVNVAARLEQAAPNGEILIGAETRALVRDAIRAEVQAPLELKGKSRPVDAYRVVEVVEDAAAIERNLAANASASASGARSRTRLPIARASSSRCSAPQAWGSRASSPTSSSASRAQPTSSAVAASRTARASRTGRSWRCSYRSTSSRILS